MNQPTAEIQLASILSRSIELGASDIHASVGQPIHYRVDGQLQRQATGAALTFDQARTFANAILTTEELKQLDDRGSVDGAYSLDDQHRFRFNAYLRNGETCFSFRQLSNHAPTLSELGLSDRLYDLCGLTDGLVLVAGPTGSGKSTTIASMIDRINQTRACHIITIEDPVEYIHPSARSLVNQRQVGRDVETFGQALLDAVRQDPDVILVGELRNLETIRTAITAAETGHLVFASVHAGDCKTAVERLVGSFSADEQNLAQRLVATVLRSVIVQHLLPRFHNPNSIEKSAARRVLASEVMFGTAAVSNLIANGNLNQLATVIQTSGDDGMWTLDDSLAKLWRSRFISEQTARSLARNPDTVAQIARRSRA